MDVQPFSSELDFQHQFYEGWTGHRSEDETPPEPTQKRTWFQSALDEKASDAPPIHPRKLRPIQPDRSAAPQDVPQRAPSPHSVLPPPLSTLPVLRLSRRVGFDDLLNPISGDKINASGRQHDGEGTDSPRTAPTAAKSRLPTLSLPSTSINKHSLNETTLPSNAPALTNTYPCPRTLPAAHTSSAPPPQPSPRLCQMSQCGPNPSTYPHMQTSFDRFGNLVALANPASQNSSLTAHYRRNSPSPQVASTGEAQSSFSAPFTSSTMPQLGFAKETGASGQSQVPVDVQAASKSADEKRKRNATASCRFRQRRKEKEKEMLDKISKLVAEVKYYRLERDFLQNKLQENRIPIPPRAPSPRRRRYASLGGSQHHDTSAYAPLRWQPSHTVELPPPMPTIRAHTGATTKDAFPRAISS